MMFRQRCFQRIFPFLLILSLLSRGCLGFTFYNVVFYSSCTNNGTNQTSESTYNDTHQIVQNYIRTTLSMYNEFLRNIKHGYKSEYVTFDVCNDRKKLVRELETLLLDPKYFVQDYDRAYVNSSLATIFVYAPEDRSMIQLVKRFVHDVPIIDTFEMGMFKSYAKKLGEWVRDFGKEKVLLLSVKSDKGLSLYDQYYQDSVYYFKKSKLCFRYGEISTQWKIENETRFDIAWIRTQKPAIILFGFPENQLEIFGQ